MNKIITLLSLALMAGMASATTVELTGDKEVVWIGQTVYLNFELHSKDKVSGQLVIVNLDTGRQEKTLVNSASPSCSCRPDYRISGDYTDNISYTPGQTGSYRARAYFDGVEKTFNFTVKSRLQEETAASTTTAAMAATSMPTAASSTTTATTSTTPAVQEVVDPTTTIELMTTTLPQITAATITSSEENRPRIPVFIGIILISSAIAFAGYKLKESGR